LRTADNSVAWTRAGILISDTELLVREARRFLAAGPARTIPDVIAFLAERRRREMRAGDDRLRLGSLSNPTACDVCAALGVSGVVPLARPARTGGSQSAAQPHGGPEHRKSNDNKIDRHVRPLATRLA
jgi:hypothetical protein